MHGFVLEEKSPFKTLGLTFCFKLEWGYYIVSIAKTASKKIGALTLTMKFHSSGVALHLYKSDYDLEWNTVVMSGLVLPVCYLYMLDKLQKRVSRTVGLHLLPLLNPWLIVEM